MGLEAAYDALVLRLDMSGEIGSEVLNPNVLKTIRNNMSREVVLEQKYISICGLKCLIPFSNPFLIHISKTRFCYVVLYTVSYKSDSMLHTF